MEHMDKEIQRSSMVFYESFYDSTKDLSPEEFKEAWTALCDYAFYDQDPDKMSPIVAMFFKMARPNIDKVIELRDRGSSGGAKKPVVKKSRSSGSEVSKQCLEDKKPVVKNQTSSPIYDEDYKTIDEDVDVDVDRQTIDEDQEAEADGGQSGQSVTPTYEDVVKECREQKYPAAIASKFFMHYDKSSWTTNDGEPVRDWKKMLGIWVNNEKEEKPPNKRGKPSGWKEYQQRGAKTNDELEAMLLDMGG